MPRKESPGVNLGRRHVQERGWGGAGRGERDLEKELRRGGGDSSAALGRGDELAFWDPVRNNWVIGGMRNEGRGGPQPGQAGASRRRLLTPNPFSRWEHGDSPLGGGCWCGLFLGPRLPMLHPDQAEGEEIDTCWVPTKRACDGFDVLCTFPV